MPKNLTLLFALIVFTLANPAFASKTSFYGKAAGWLFDSIKNPTSRRNFNLVVNGQTVGCTQIEVGNAIECTLHGTTAAFPNSSKESQTALCTISADSIDTTFPGDAAGDITVEGDAAKSIFDNLTKVDHTIHDAMYKSTQTMKSLGQAGVDGVMCFGNVPDDTTKPSTYSCSISWK